GPDAVISGAPVWIGHTFAISLQRFDGRVHSKVAIISFFILPALVPVDSSLDSRIPRAKQFQSLLNPFGFVARMRELSGAPLCNHNWLIWVDAAHLLVRPVDQRRYVSPCLIFILLTIDT